MNKKKLIFWGVIAATAIFVFNLLHEFFGGQRAMAYGPGGGHGRGPAGMGQAHGFAQQGGFGGGHHAFMNASHHGGFPWLVLIIGLAVLVLLLRWLRNKSKTSSMEQFIDTSLVSSQTPITNQNARILDQWEKNITNQKENE